MKYENAVVLGTGVLAIFCAEKLRAHGLPVIIYDMDQNNTGMIKRRADALGIPCEHPQAKEAFAVLGALNVPTLVVSAINPYILPGWMLENPHLTAINCHQALLPAHPGRNAEMWAIYEGDARTGITWHELTAEVDAGDILMQRDMEITQKHTSYQVFREQIKLAQEAFAELLPQLLSGEEVKAQPQELGGSRKLHYSTEVPNKGELDLSWDAEKISAFLRAMDYSILGVMPQPQVEIGGQRYTVKKYKITQAERNPQNPEAVLPEDLPGGSAKSTGEDGAGYCEKDKPGTIAASDAQETPAVRAMSVEDGAEEIEIDAETISIRKGGLIFALKI